MLEKTANTNDSGKRFDVVARAAFPDLPLSQVFSAIRSGKLKLNGKKHPANTRLENGDKIQYYGTYQDTQPSQPICTLKTQDIRVLWQNEHFIVVNKPAGVKTHDGCDSLQAWVLHYLGEGHDLSFRPGPCHRLDRLTSGIIVFSKDIGGARSFAHYQKEKSFTKVYIGVLSGVLKNEVLWQDQLSYAHHKSYKDTQGRVAQTQVIPLAVYQNKTVALFGLLTGRTHQIRSQAAHAGHPLVGDAKYEKGPHKESQKYYLHAIMLSTIRQEDDLFPTLWADVPENWVSVLNDFGLSMPMLKTRIKERFLGN